MLVKFKKVNDGIVYLNPTFICAVEEFEDPGDKFRPRYDYRVIRTRDGHSYHVCDTTEDILTITGN